MATTPASIVLPGVDALAATRTRPWYLDVWVQMLRRKPLGSAGAFIVIVMLAAAVLADVITPYGFAQTSLGERFIVMDRAHWLGTDQLGRDLLTRLVYGARVSLYVGFGAVVLGSVLATLVGILSAYFGGRGDLLVQRGVDALMAFPPLLLLMSVMALVGPTAWHIPLVLGVAFGIQNSRLIRSVAPSMKEHAFLDRARAARRQRSSPEGTMKMGGPDMAPQAPPTFGAPRRSRGAPLYCYLLMVVAHRLVKLGHRHDATVQRKHLLDVELLRLEVLDQVDAVRVRVRRTRRRRVRRQRRVGVGLDEDLLLGQIDHDQSVVVEVARDVTDLHRARAIGQHSPIAHALDLRGAPGLGQVIRPNGCAVRDRALEERPVDLVGDDGDALAGGGADAARMIEVVVGVDEVTDRLAGHEALHLGQHGQGTLLVDRALDEDQVIFHLDERAVVRASGQEPHAVGDHLRCDPGVGLRRGPDVVGDLDVHRGVGPHVGDGQVENWKPARGLQDLRGELHAAEVPVVQVTHLDGHLSQHGMGHHRLDERDEIL